MSELTNCGANPVLALEIDRNGSVTKKAMKLDQDSQLTNSLLQRLYPGIRVATVDVPTEPLDPCEQAIVEHTLTQVEVDGLRYSLVGASGSAKNGKFYAVEKFLRKEAWGEISLFSASCDHLLRHSRVRLQGASGGTRLSCDGGR